MASTFHGYALDQVIVPTTLVANTAYLSIRNTSVNRDIVVTAVQIHSLFTGAAAATRSIFALQRFQGTPTGGAAVVPVKLNPGSPAAQVEILFSNSGLTVTPGSTDRFYRFVAPSQLTLVSEAHAELNEDSPIHLPPGYCLLLLADNTIINGAALSANVKFYEVL